MLSLTETKKSSKKKLLQEVTNQTDDKVATPGHNSIGERVSAFFNDVDALGKQSALGTTALTSLAERVVAAASDGLIQPTNAQAIFERYAKANLGAGGTPGSVKTNTSKIRKLIELGCLPEGAQISDDAARMREDVANAKSPFEGLVEVARSRLSAKRKLSDDEIRTALTKAKPRPKAASGEWLAISKRVSTLVAAKEDVGPDVLEMAREIKIELKDSFHKAMTKPLALF
jgi:hypothetical protein